MAVCTAEGLLAFVAVLPNCCYERSSRWQWHRPCPGLFCGVVVLYCAAAAAVFQAYQKPCRSDITVFNAADSHSCPTGCTTRASKTFRVTVNTIGGIGVNSGQLWFGCELGCNIQRPQDPQAPAQEQQQQSLQRQHPAPPGLQPRQSSIPPGPPPGLHPAARQHSGAPMQQLRPPHQQQPPVTIYRVKVASPEVAARLVSPAAKAKLHQGGTGIYVEHWLTPSQLQARRNMRPLIQQLQQRNIHCRWSLEQPTELQQRVQGPDQRWRWQAVYPPPPLD